MINGLSLESFDRADAVVPADNSIYKDGYDQGVADTHKSHEADQGKLAAELIQSLSDLEFKYVEARTEITASLAPLFTAVIQKVLPACVAQSFVMQITSALQEAAALAVDHPFKIAVHPSQEITVSSLLQKSGSKVAITTDENLSHHAAWIALGREEQQIDLDAVTRKIEIILSTISQSDQRNTNNG